MSKTLTKRTQTTRNDQYNTRCATWPIMGSIHWFYHFDETTQTGLGSNAINQFWIFNGCRRQILVAKCSELIMLAKYKPYFSLLYELPYPFYLILLHTILFNWIHFIHTQCELLIHFVISAWSGINKWELIFNSKLSEQV